MEQLEQMMVGAQLDQRRAGVMTKARIGLFDDLAEFAVGKVSPTNGRITRKRPPHTAAQQVPRYPRASFAAPRRAHRAAVAGKARQHRLFETQNRGRAAVEI